MRVHATHHLGTGSAAPMRRAAGGGGFSVSEPESARTPAQGTAPRAVASLDVLVALQAIQEAEDPRERRRRAVRRGGAVLDALEALKVALLSGQLDAGALERLHAAAEGLGEGTGGGTGDPRLDAVLAEIGLRAAVELAKFSRR